MPTQWVIVERDGATYLATWRLREGRVYVRCLRLGSKSCPLDYGEPAQVATALLNQMISDEELWRWATR